MSRLSSKVNQTFVYTTAADSSKPNYLRRKFAAIQRDLEAQRKAAEEAAKAEQVGKVRQLKGAK